MLCILESLNHKNKMNRKGDAGEGLLIFMFVFIATIILAGVIASISIFYGKEHNANDVKIAESKLLSSRVIECFLSSEKDFFSEDFDIYEECGLDRGVIEKEHLIYISQGDKEFLAGVGDYKKQCFFEGARENDNYPKCAESYVQKDDKSYLFVVGSNQRRRIAGA